MSVMLKSSSGRSLPPLVVQIGPVEATPETPDREYRNEGRKLAEMLRDRLPSGTYNHFILAIIEDAARSLLIDRKIDESATLSAAWDVLACGMVADRSAD